jgi:hypothetical protein
MYMHSEAHPQSREVAELIAAALVKAGYSVETRSSVVHTRIYIGASNDRTDEHYIVQLDKN